MKVNLSFVPPGGGEQDYMLSVELPSIPKAGDLISIIRQGGLGTEDFIVNRTRYNISASQDGNNAQVADIWVECEFAVSETSSESHKKACAVYEVQQEMPATMF